MKAKIIKIFVIIAFLLTLSSGCSSDDSEKLAAISTLPVTDITTNSAKSGGIITDNGGSEIAVRGICWSSEENPTFESNEGRTSDGMGIGEFSSKLEDLLPDITYYVRAYAINSDGTAYGGQEEFVIEIGEVYNPATGEIWLDRNLGAYRVASSSIDEEAYGDLYQWGRGGDGHQLRTSDITSTLSNSDYPGHGDFIITPEEPYDWRSPHNDNLWQGVNGINNPCPPGFRIPTEDELNAEKDSWSSKDAAGAFDSPLKWVLGGRRDEKDGTINYEASQGIYWNSFALSNFSGFMLIHTDNAYTNYSNRACGMSIRCIKD